MDTQDGFIVGIYNYCDRWCERCTLAGRCRVFAEEQRLSFEIPAAPAATPAQATDQAQSPVVLDNLEILFDKDLQQDPLRLLQSISRNRAVVASWNGIMNSGRLLYAETGHPEYRSYDSVDALIVGMDGTATVDSAQNNREAGQA